MSGKVLAARLILFSFVTACVLFIIGVPAYAAMQGDWGPAIGVGTILGIIGLFAGIVWAGFNAFPEGS